MKNRINLLGMTAAVALIALPAVADSVQSHSEYRYNNESFMLIDTNVDGTISYQEFESNSKPENREASFAKLDTNGDKEISHEELKSYFKERNKKFEAYNMDGVESYVRNLTNEEGVPVGSLDAKHFPDSNYPGFEA